MVKMTFTVDEETADTLKRVAIRLHKPQSQVIREAIRYYEPHAGQLTLEERKRRLALFDRVLAAIPQRPVEAVDDELGQVRRSRRQGWRSRTSHDR